MNLQEAIRSEHSKVNTARIAQWIGQDKKRFDELVQLLLHGEYRIIQRAAWILSTCTDQYPNLIEPYTGQLLEYCAKKNIHDAVKRNITRIFQTIPIPLQHHEAAMNICFQFLTDPKEAIAIRCFSMSILAALCVSSYPEIKQELKMVIEDALSYQQTSAAFKNRAGKTLQQIRKISNLY